MISMRAGRPIIVHGVVSIVDDVEKHLLQLVGVADDIGQSLIEVLDDVDAVAVEIVRTQLNGTAKNQVELYGVALRRHLTGEAQVNSERSVWCVELPEE